jgi:hypothetical protein
VSRSNEDETTVDLMKVLGEGHPFACVTRR